MENVVKAGIRNHILGVLCLSMLGIGLAVGGPSYSTNVSSSNMVESGKDIGIDRYILGAIHVETQRLHASNNTNSNKNASVGYSPEKIEAALEWYRAFKNADGHQIDAGDIKQAFIYAKALSSVDGTREDALVIYDSLLKSKLERHEKRQIQAETGSLLIRLATHSKDDVRKQYLSRAKRIADELLWVQDLWFGRGVALLAHIYMLEGDYDNALKLLDDFKPQLMEIDKALRLQSTAEDDLTKVSPIAEVRYVVAVAMHEKAKNLIVLNSDKSEILKLLIGDRTARTSGAFQHFLNVAIRYTESEWAADSAQRAAAISYLLDKRYGLRVRL
jgi:hypothetical protein